MLLQQLIKLKLIKLKLIKQFEFKLIKLIKLKLIKLKLSLGLRYWSFLLCAFRLLLSNHAYCDLRDWVVRIVQRRGHGMRMECERNSFRASRYACVCPFSWIISQHVFWSMFVHSYKCRTFLCSWFTWRFYIGNRYAFRMYYHRSSM